MKYFSFFIVLFIQEEIVLIFLLKEQIILIFC